MSDPQKPGLADARPAAAEAAPGDATVPVEVLGAAEKEPVPKSDPESMALRGQPPRIERFKRSAIMATSGGVALVIFGVAGWALSHHAPSPTATSDRGDVGTKGTPQALAGLATSYDKVPLLGRPLPGDLGKPILEHERGLDGLSSTPSASRSIDQAAEAEQQRQIAQEISARQSGVMSLLPAEYHQADLPPATADAPSTAKAKAKADATDAGTEAQEEKRSFAATSATNSPINPHSVMVASSPIILMAGSVIAASLITGINSDLPGLVTAQVTENVFDSPTGQILVIPQGTRMIGVYDSSVSFGQRRALLVWQRLIFPDGSSLQIDNIPAVDVEGYAGLRDRVDGHGWTLLKGVVFSTLLGIGTQLGIGGDDDLARAIRESTQQSVAHAGDQFIGKSLNVQPTIKVRPGWPLRVIVQKDLMLRAWSGLGN
jgi:type IV secretory pathway VirB10-like protein